MTTTPLRQYPPASAVWFLVEVGIATALCSIPPLWTGGVTDQTLTQGLVLASLFIIPSEILRHFVGFERLKKFLVSHYSMSGAEILQSERTAAAEFQKQRFSALQILLEQEGEKLRAVIRESENTRSEAMAVLVNGLSQSIKESTKLIVESLATTSKPALVTAQEAARQAGQEAFQQAAQQAAQQATQQAASVMSAMQMLERAAQLRPALGWGRSGTALLFGLHEPEMQRLRTEMEQEEERFAHAMRTLFDMLQLGSDDQSLVEATVDEMRQAQDRHRAAVQQFHAKLQNATQLPLGFRIPEEQR
jgi:hypothetical protein